MIVGYKHPSLSGKPCMIHESFREYMDWFCLSLISTNFKAFVTSAYRADDNVAGAIVVPAKKSNHMIGHAIDVNLIDEAGKYWNSKALLTPDENVRNFIKLVKKRMRWGGDFATADSVHFDSGINMKNPAEWQRIYIEIRKQKIT